MDVAANRRPLPFPTLRCTIPSHVVEMFVRVHVWRDAIVQRIPHGMVICNKWRFCASSAGVFVFKAPPKIAAN